MKFSLMDMLIFFVLNAKNQWDQHLSHQNYRMQRRGNNDVLSYLISLSCFRKKLVFFFFASIHLGFFD